MQSDHLSAAPGLKETSPVLATPLCGVLGDRDLRPALLSGARTFGRAPEGGHFDLG
jgi:hypothetical protein